MDFCFHGLNVYVSKTISFREENLRRGDCEAEGTLIRDLEHSNGHGVIWIGPEDPTPLTPARPARKAYSAESSSHSAEAVKVKGDGLDADFHCFQILSETGSRLAMVQWRFQKPRRGGFKE
jgi:hypothetical protein